MFFRLENNHPTLKPKIIKHIIKKQNKASKQTNINNKDLNPKNEETNILNKQDENDDYKEKNAEDDKNEEGNENAEDIFDKPEELEDDESDYEYSDDFEVLITNHIPVE